jgi:hypothetical protein
MSLNQLSPQEVNQALQLLSRAWETESDLMQLKVPPNLKHLQRPDWEQLCRTLALIMYQKDRSLLH